MKFGVSFLIFLAGVASGVAGLGGYWYWAHQSTEVWVVDAPMTSSEGIFIPAGTQFVFREQMPEGFTVLELSVNVEGTALSKFSRRVEEKSFFRLPYWLGEVGQ